MVFSRKIRTTVRTRIIAQRARTLELPLLVRSGAFHPPTRLGEQAFWCAFLPSSRGDLGHMALFFKFSLTVLRAAGFCNIRKIKIPQKTEMCSVVQNSLLWKRGEKHCKKRVALAPLKNIQKQKFTGPYQRMQV